MKRKLLIMTALAVFSLAVRAQGTVNDMTRDFGARVSASVDKKVMKGLHVSADAEWRLTDDFSNPGRFQVGAGVSYKISPMFKVGGGYLFIERRNSEGKWKPRHRVYLDGTASLRAGDWRFSLKERLQLTCREVGNTFQKNPNSLELKSRLKVSYKGFLDVTPYAYAELRNVFNDPACSATWNSSTHTYSDYSFLGYGDAYVNRIRGSLGAEWKLSKSHALDFFVLTDYCYDKVIDTDKAGTTLNALTYDQALNIALGVGYTFSF